VAPHGTQTKISTLRASGFFPLPKPYVTCRFPATHIAFVTDPTKDKGACEQMFGFSTSDDVDSPILKSIGLWGGTTYDSETQSFLPFKLQHLAYDIDPKRSIDEVRAEMEAQGTQFMTPILRYQEPNGATLEQMFVACRVPYGPFVEIIRRGAGRDGAPFQGFHPDQIDNLYEHYDRYSKSLLI
jgi:hypothetical protein